MRPLVARSLLYMVSFASFLGVAHLLSLLSITFYHWVSYRTLTGTVNIVVTGSTAGDVAALTVLTLPLASILFLAPERKTRSLLPLFYVLAPLALTLLFFVVGSPLWRPWFVLAALASSAVSFVLSREWFGLARGEAFRHLVVGFLVVVVVLEVLSSLAWLVLPPLQAPPYQGSGWGPAWIESQLFFALQPLVPYLILVVLFLWVLVPFAPQLGRAASRILPWAEDRENPDGTRTEGYDVFGPRTMLLVGIAASVLLPLFPQTFGLGPWEGFVGADTRHYYRYLDTLWRMPFSQAIADPFVGGFGGERPIYFLLVYLLGQVSNASAELVARLQPALIAPLVTVAVFLFVRVGTEDKFLAGLAALLTPLTYTMTVGMFGGLYTQWLGVAEMYLSLTLLLLYFKRRNAVYVIGAALASILLLFTHPWTWDVLMALLVAYALHKGITGFRALREVLRTDIIPLVTFLGINGLAEFSKGYLLDSFSGSKALQGAVSTFGLGLEHLLRLDFNLFLTSMVDFGGFYTNPLLLVLALAGLALAIRSQDRFSRVLLAWVFVVSAVFPFLDFKLQARFLYVLPFHILAAVALRHVSDPRKVLGQRRVRALVVLVPVLVFATYTLRALANLVFYI